MEERDSSRPHVAPRNGAGIGRRPGYRTAFPAALAALPAVLVVLFWLRSYLPADFHPRPDAGRVFLFFTDAATTRSYFAIRPERPVPATTHVWSRLAQSPAPSERSEFTIAGCRYIAHAGTSVTRFVAVSVPYPYLLPPTLLPLWWLHRRRRRRTREAHNLCARCGYHLRESKDRCPECGAGVAAPPQA